MWVSGSNDVFERLDLHHNMGPGLFIQDGGGNLVLDCDSHENYDPLTSNGAGQSADGFGCHIAQGGTGNVFRGCRAWWNSDDGWDLIQAAEVVTVEKSWSWYNGYLPGTMTPAPAGNGNGFKAGGFGVPETKVPAIPPSHVIRNCLSFLNKAAGFYANHEPVADHFYNNTAYANHPDFDLLGMLPDGTVQNLGILRNNLAYGGTLLGNATGPMVDASHDSWDLSPALTVGDGDFLSTSVAGMDGPRQADGSLPCVPFMRLAPTSQLIDRGVDVGIAFLGAAPDLGAFEQGACVSSPPPGTGGGPGSGGSGGMAGMTGGTGGAGATATGGAGGGGQGGFGGGFGAGFGLPGTGGAGPSASGGAPTSGGTGGVRGGSADASSAAGSDSVPGARPPGEGAGGGGCSCALNGDGAGASGTEARLALALGALMALTLRRRRTARPSRLSRSKGCAW
jgi:MYXO-CTERM domain-containing protein